MFPPFGCCYYCCFYSQAINTISATHLLTFCSLLANFQVGCPLRCAFCATGKGGYSRNLKPHEIVEQVRIERLLQFVGRLWTFSIYLKIFFDQPFYENVLGVNY